MPTKDFEHIIQFRQVQTQAGIVKLPLVTVILVQASGGRVSLPLMFDTGASVTTLRHDLYPMLGLSAWDVGQQVDTLTAGGAQPVPAYQYTATLELFGKSVQCPVHLQVLPVNPLYVGLLGRETFFEQFGFGFWESSGELFATNTP
jgi:hypothetical protein